MDQLKRLQLECGRLMDYHDEMHGGNQDYTLGAVRKPSGNRSKRKFALTRREKKILKSIKRLNKFKARDLDSIRFVHWKEFEHYENILTAKLTVMIGFPEIDWRHEKYVCPVELNSLVRKGHFFAWQHARALQIAKYQCPIKKDFTKHIQKRK